MSFYGFISVFLSLLHQNPHVRYSGCYNNPSQIDEDLLLNDLPGYDADIDYWDTISTYYDDWERE